jgi:hypothetical protein
VIIDGTDANDHGDVDSGPPETNEEGWLYMQRALENIASQVHVSVTKTVVNLGAGSNHALEAITSAFDLSTLPGAGWTLQTVDGTSNIDTWLASLNTTNTGILYIPTAGGLDPGDVSEAELAIINGRANEINTFVAGPGDPTLGGGLFAMAESTDPQDAIPYGWLQTLIPGITITELGSGGENSPLTLTPAGTAAFPGLSNADLSSGPWHDFFSGNLGGLSVLATGPEGGVTRNVILGGGAGTVIGCGEPGQPACEEPGPGGVIPEPGTMGLWMMGLAGFGIVKRRHVA